MISANKKKIVFLSFHNWNTRRYGGFHKFAEEACYRGYETIFFSFERPFYIYFKNDERLNRKVLLNLMKGVLYSVGDFKLLNITYPTFSMPGPVRKIIPNKLNYWLQTHSVKSFRDFAIKYFSDTDYFIFESNEAVLLYRIIRKMFPESKFIYRPSDPLIADQNKYYHSFEKVIVNESDWVFIVNKEGYELYKKNIPNFCLQKNVSILSNGVSTTEYTKTYYKPDYLAHENTALYVGAREIDWDLIIYSSKVVPEITFVIVCPETPNKNFREHLRNSNNVIYLPGIAQKQVPAWITNCNCVIVPNPKDMYKYKPWGLTAKYYQAMAAKKPIVAYHDQPTLRDLGIYCSYTFEDFVYQLKLAIKCGPINYKLNLQELDWKLISNRFYYKLNNMNEK